MSRSNYSEDPDQNWSWICWRGAVNSAIKGKRGQAFLKELLETLDSMPEKKLISDDLITPEGDVCAIGSVLKKRGIDTSNVDVYDADKIAELAGISQALVREIEYINDEAGYWNNETKEEQRWNIVRNWVAGQIREE